MSREIKFRAWDRVSTPPKMIEDWDGAIDLLHSDAEVMQYTGLKDSKGAEIYEGDIVGQYKNCLFDEGYINNEVEFIHDQFCSNGCSLLQAVNYFGARVIGNIYENPELLTTHKA